MRKLGYLGILGLLAVLVAGCAGSGSSDSSSRKAAIGSSAPVAGDATIASSALVGGAPIKVSSWSWDGATPVNVSSSTGAAAVSKPNLGDFRVTKNIDNTSTTLFRNMVGGTALAAPLTFTVGKSLTYTFDHAYVTSIKQTGDGGDGNEEVTFAYTKVTMVNNAAGTSPTVFYDVALGKGG